MARPLEKRQIFPDEQAKLHFLELLSVLPTRFGLKIHGYVLMGEPLSSAGPDAQG
jgi:hypothetical protein